MQSCRDNKKAGCTGVLAGLRKCVAGSAQPETPHDVMLTRMRYA